MNRKRVVTLLVVVALVALVASAAALAVRHRRTAECPAPPDEPVPVSLADVQGTWAVVKVELPDLTAGLRAAFAGVTFEEVAVEGRVVTVSDSPPRARAGNETVPQPVAFSHAHHVGKLGIACAYCHAQENTGGAKAPAPTATRTCMNCHQQIWQGAKLLEPIRDPNASGFTHPALRFERSFLVTVDGTKSPAQADFVACDQNGVVGSGAVIGRAILKYEGETLVIAVAGGGRAAEYRPEEFKPAPAGPDRPPVVVLHLKRK